MPMLTGNWENPQVYRHTSERLKIKKAKKFISMGSRYVNLKKKYSVEYLNIPYSAF